MEPEHDGLEHDFPLQLDDFEVPCSSSRVYACIICGIIDTMNYALHDSFLYHCHSPANSPCYPMHFKFIEKSRITRFPPSKGHPIKSALVNIRGAHIQYEDSIKLIPLGNFLGVHGMNQYKSPINRLANLTTRWVCPGPGIENLKVQKSPKQLYREAPCNVSMWSLK